jgi:hypothetical protein
VPRLESATVKAFIGTPVFWLSGVRRGGVMRIPIPTPVLTGSGSKGSQKASQDRQALRHRATPGLGRIVQERKGQCGRANLFLDLFEPNLARTAWFCSWIQMPGSKGEFKQRFAFSPLSEPRSSCHSKLKLSCL